MSIEYLTLEEGEEEEYDGLPREVVLKRYMKRHRNEVCPHCQRRVGNHSLKRFSRCVSHETEKLAIQEEVDRCSHSLS